MLDAVNYIADHIQGAYKEQGVPLKRRAIETVLRSVSNTTHVLDGGDSDYSPGDVAPYTAVEDFNSRDLGKKSLHDAGGLVLKENVGSLKIGTIIDEHVHDALKKMGKHEVTVGNRPIVHQPFLTGVTGIPYLRQDWLAQMGYRHLRDAIVGGATMGHESDIHGYSPVPAFTYGAEFGAAPNRRSKDEGVY